MTSKPDVILFLSDARGQYIPRDFAQSIKRSALSGVKDKDLETLEAGPDHEWYWEAWSDVCRDAVITDEHGNKFHIWQDGDCWLVPEGMELTDHDGFQWPEEEDADLEDADGLSRCAGRRRCQQLLFARLGGL